MESLVITNTKGQEVTIPERYELEVLDMLKEGCHGCIDDLVSVIIKEQNKGE